jgi:hypothetical protein
MGKTIYISDELHEFLSGKTRSVSFDTVIKQLLHLETFEGRIVNKQVSKEKLAPLKDYYQPILKNIGLPRRHMQGAVGDYLRDTGHFDRYPDELVKMRNTQERWKVRFSNALNGLKKEGFIEPVETILKNWEGGKYELTPKGKVFLESLETDSFAESVSNNGQLD